jgi:hypothetical protein
MGNSSNVGTTGHTPWASPPNTTGPSGSNSDAGDPHTPRWFVGDTPGTLGVQDHADPNGRMCRMAPRRSRIGEYLSQEAERLRRERAIVQRELIETLRIREAYIDKSLLEKAKSSGWTGAEFDAAVKEKLFGKPAAGDKGQNYISPMGTDPMNCRIKENWDAARYRKEGLPEVIYEADRAHELAHQQSCKALPSMEYNAAMSFPEKLSADEEKAYTAKIKVLEAWLHQHAY